MERALPASHRPPRAVRSAAVAGVAVATSLGGHALAGGALPGVPALGAFTLALVALTTALSRSRWTPVRLVGALAVAQGGFHLVFQHLSGAHGTAVDLRMLGWHLAAGALTSVLILRAEAWWWQVFAGLRLRRVRACPPPSPRALPPSRRAPGPRLRFFDRAVFRRGPPLSSAVSQPRSGPRSKGLLACTFLPHGAAC
jgi:hypothetical protein